MSYVVQNSLTQNVHKTASIHETAIVHPNTVLAEGVEIGPWTYVGPDVVIGARTKIGPHVVLKGPLRIGEDNEIFQFASVGEVPQDKKFKGEQSILEIGDRNIIREHATLQRGTGQGGGITRIGDDNLIMNYVHIAHDCIVGNQNIFANYSALAGHVIIENKVTFAGYSAVHQFCRVSSYAFVARAAMVQKDVLPYIMVVGNDAKTVGLNTVGLQRAGFDEQTIMTLRKAYKIIYRSALTVADAMPKLQELAQDCPEVLAMMRALEQSERGILR